MRHGQDPGEAETRIATHSLFGELHERGKAGVAVVADRHGELIAPRRADGCALPSIVIAQNKAYAAARVRKPSGDPGRNAGRDGSDVQYHDDARYIGWDGVAPVVHGGHCLGAVAVSGLSGEEDLEMARLGIDASLADRS